MKHLILTSTAALLLASTAVAQDRPASKSELRFDHYRDYDALVAESKALAAAHPGLLTYVEIGKSVEGRPMFALILDNPKTPVVSVLGRAKEEAPAAS